MATFAPISRAVASVVRAGVDGVVDAVVAAKAMPPRKAWSGRSVTILDRLRRPKPSRRSRTLDAAPSVPRQDFARPHETMPAAQPAQEQALDEADKSPRRRSTVREKVSFLFDASSDAAAPAISVEASALSHEPQHDKPADTAADDDNAPRRAGCGRSASDLRFHFQRSSNENRPACRAVFLTAVRGTISRW